MAALAHRCQPNRNRCRHSKLAQGVMEEWEDPPVEQTGLGFPQAVQESPKSRLHFRVHDNTGMYARFHPLCCVPCTDPSMQRGTRGGMEGDTHVPHAQNL